jgi:hypothetical protein
MLLEVAAHRAAATTAARHPLITLERTQPTGEREKKMGKEEGLADYREVPERIAEWYERHPEGRIECSIVEFTDKRVIVQARVYRTQERDELPSGIGHSFLDLPGKTNFTRGSELENAETSAAGRALVMAGIPTSRISSQFEVTMKSSDEATGTGQGSAPLAPDLTNRGVGASGDEGAGVPPSSPPTLDAKQQRAFRELFNSPAQALQRAREVLERPDLPSIAHLTVAEASLVVAVIQEERDNEHALSGEGYGG